MKETVFKIFALLAMAFFVHSLSSTAEAQSSGHHACFSFYKSQGQTDFNAKRLCPTFASHGYVSCLKTYKNYQLPLSDGRQHCPTTAGYFYSSCLEFYVDRETDDDFPTAAHFSKARRKCSHHVSGSYLYCLETLESFGLTMMRMERYCKLGRTTKHVNCLVSEKDAGSSFLTAKRNCRNTF